MNSKTTQAFWSYPASFYDFGHPNVKINKHYCVAFLRRKKKDDRFFSRMAKKFLSGTKRFFDTSLQNISGKHQTCDVEGYD